MDFDRVFNILRSFLEWLWAFPQVKLLSAHIVVNVVVAVAVAIKTDAFRLHRLWEFLYRKVLPLLAVFAASAAAADAAGLGGLQWATFALLESTLIADLTDNLAKLGLSLPTALRKE